MEKTVWELVADALLDEMIDVYPPATKTGDCTSPYVVLKQNGSIQYSGISSEQQLYYMICYVPKNQYTELSRFVSKCKEIISSKVFPMLIPTGDETPDFYDDTFSAHTRSVEYRNSVFNPDLRK